MVAINQQLKIKLDNRFSIGAENDVVGLPYKFTLNSFHTKF